MTKRTVLGAAVLLIFLGAPAGLAGRAQAITTEAMTGEIEEATLVVLKQSLDILQTQLNVMAQRIQAPNRTAEETQALAIILESVRMSLVTLDQTLGTRALALASPMAAPTSPASPAERETALTVLAPQADLETEETAVAALAIGSGGGWKKAGRVVWIVVVAALVVWVAYNEIWRKRIASRGEKSAPKTA